MTSRTKLYQAEGRTVPQEDGTPWPAEGLAVEHSRYIRRRLADGDLTEKSPAKPKPEKTDAKAKTGDEN